VIFNIFLSTTKITFKRVRQWTNK